MIDAYERTARDMLWVIMNRTTAIRITLPQPEVYPQDYFPGQESGKSATIPADDGDEIFQVHLARAIEEVAQKVAHIQKQHAFSQFTVVCVRRDTEFAKGLGYDYNVKWFPLPNSGGGLDDDDSNNNNADWWKT